MPVGCGLLSGRTQDLRAVEGILRSGGTQRGVLLVGSPGVGKTRLARESLASAARRGARTQWVAATASARELSLGAFSAVTVAAGGDPVYLLRQAVDTLTAGAGSARIVIGIDDAHLLDDLSALLVHRLVLQAEVRVLVTVRTGELVPEPITALWKDGHLERWEVQPFSSAETTTALEAVLHGPVDRAGVDHLWSVTRGNALFLRHIVDGDLAAGRLRAIHGLWRWCGEPEVPPGLAELVTSQMGELTGCVRDVVDLLALAEPLEVPLLARLVDAASVEQAEDRGLVDVEQGAPSLRARLAHPLYGEVRRSNIGVLRARRLRGRIATALDAAKSGRPEDLLRRAVMVVDSDLDQTVYTELLAQACAGAIGLLDLSLAERLGRAAVLAGGGFDARLRLSYVLSWSSRGEEADAELRALAGLARSDAQRVQVALPRAANLFWTQGRTADAETLLDRAEATVTDTAALNVLTAVRSAFHAGLGRPGPAVESGAAALAQPLPDEAVVLASWGLIAGLGALGRAEEIPGVADRAYQVSSRSRRSVVNLSESLDLHDAGHDMPEEGLAFRYAEQPCDHTVSLR